MKGKNNYQGYDLHYSRMQNTIPDWDGAMRKPGPYICRKPWLPADKNSRILDFGCGWGYQLLSLWCTGYKKIEGIELSPEQAEVCRKSSKGLVPIHQVSGESFLKRKKGHYDLIILNDVIEHIDKSKVKRILMGIRASLRPGGMIVLKTPNMSSLIATYSRYLDITHETGYTEFSIQQLLDEIGFVDHRFIPDYWGWNPGAWRPWAPLRGLGIPGLLNHLLHKFFFRLRSQRPFPTRYDYNIEIYSKTPLKIES